MTHEPTARFRTLLIDHDLDIRMRLKESLLSVYYFIGIVNVSSVKQAREALLEDEGFDLIFISYNFSEQEVMEIVEHARLSNGGADSAFILVSSQLNKHCSEAARYMQGGIDCILHEPFSTDELVEVTSIGRNLHNSRRQVRETIATSFIVRDIIKHIDLLAQLRKRELQGTHTIEKLKGMVNLVKQFHPAAQEQYFVRVLDLFTSLPFPEKCREPPPLKTASLRVRDAFECFCLQTIENEIKDAAAERSEIVARLVRGR